MLVGKGDAPMESWIAWAAMALFAVIVVLVIYVNVMLDREVERRFPKKGESKRQSERRKSSWRI